MEILKKIGYVYLALIGFMALALFLSFPVILSDYFKNENYLWLFLINLPIFFGIIFHYIEPIGMTHTRPRR